MVVIIINNNFNIIIIIIIRDVKMIIVIWVCTEGRAPHRW